MYRKYCSLRNFGTALAALEGQATYISIKAPSIAFENIVSRKCVQRCTLWQYGLWSFQTGYTKLERFLHKNQHTQRKLLNSENWTNGEPQ